MCRWRAASRRADVPLGAPTWVMGHPGRMPSDEFETEKLAWSEPFPQGEPLHVGLGRLVGEDHDQAETEYYEAAADPTSVATESAQRHYRGMLRRRLRRHRK
jgi:hypothetical protein